MSGESTLATTQTESTQPGQTIKICTSPEDYDSLKSSMLSFGTEQLAAELKEQLESKGKMVDYDKLLKEYDENIRMINANLNPPLQKEGPPKTTGTIRTQLGITIKTGGTSTSSDKPDGMPSVYCMANKMVSMKEGTVQRVAIDLAEIVKRPVAPSETLSALFEWAQEQTQGGGKVTLTARTKGLVRVYENYGFTVR